MSKLKKGLQWPQYVENFRVMLLWGSSWIRETRTSTELTGLDLPRHCAAACATQLSSTACGEAHRAFGARGGGRAPLDSLGTPKQRALAAGSSNRFEEECSCGACSMRLSCSHFDFGVSWWDMTWMVFERFVCLFDLRAKASRFKSATSSLARRGV